MKKVLCPNGVFFSERQRLFLGVSVCGSRWPSEKRRSVDFQRSIFFVLGGAIILTIFLSPMDHVVHPHLPDFKYKTERW